MSRTTRRQSEPVQDTWLGDSKRLVIGFAAVVVVGVGVALCWRSSDEAAADPGEAAPAELAPGRFVLTEASWGPVADAPPESDEGASDGEPQVVLDFGEERKRQLAEEARERWQNLDIAIRR